MPNPLVSIVVCTHNRRHYLQQTMESIFAQTYQPVEIVVVDDGSTDNTRELIESYGDRVRYVWHENQGIAATRTTACQLAKGELIAFQDDDDLMPPDRINHLYEALRQHPTAIFATGDYAVIDSEGNLTGERSRPARSEDQGNSVLINDAYTAILWPNVPVAPHTTLFRKSDGDRIAWFDPEFTFSCSDKDFYARLGRLGPIVYLREVVSYMRRGHASIWSNDLIATCWQLMLLEKHLRVIGSERKDLRKRLQSRILRTLNRIAYYESEGIKVDDPVVIDYIKRGWTRLEFRDRVKYWWSALIKFPVRKVILRYEGLSEFLKPVIRYFR